MRVWVIAAAAAAMVSAHRSWPQAGDGKRDCAPAGAPSLRGNSAEDGGAEAPPESRQCNALA